MASVERPLISLDIFELQSYFEANTRHAASLIALFNELAHRGRKKARELRSNALAKLAELAKEGEYFTWPDTAAVPGEGAIDGVTDWPSRGMLRFLGYATGVSAPSTSERRAILDDAYLKALPNVNSDEYMKSFGSPGSAVRLKRLAQSIAGFTKNAKKKSQSSLDTAIEQWEGDLEYLRTKFYVGHYDFPWPKL